MNNKESAGTHDVTIARLEVQLEQIQSMLEELRREHREVRDLPSKVSALEQWRAGLLPKMSAIIAIIVGVLNYVQK